MSTESKAVGFGLAAVLCWSTVATAFKIALSHQTVVQLLFTATVTSTVFLACLLLYQGRLAIAISALKHNWKMAMLCGALNPLLYYVVLLSAYDLLPAQVAQPINYTWAIVLAFMAVPFLGQKLSKADFVALFICYSGVLVISSGAGGDNQEATLRGVLLALLSTVIWAAYWILNSRDKRAPTIALFQNFLCALPIAAMLAWPWSFNQAALVAGAYIGVFEMGLAFVFWLHAMKATSNTSRISNLIFLSPFISLILIYFILGERIHLNTYAGLILILGGIYIQNRKSSQ